MRPVPTVEWDSVGSGNIGEVGGVARPMMGVFGETHLPLLETFSPCSPPPSLGKSPCQVAGRVARLLALPI